MTTFMTVMSIFAVIFCLAMFVALATDVWGWAAKHKERKASSARANPRINPSSGLSYVKGKPTYPPTYLNRKQRRTLASLRRRGKRVTPHVIA